MPRTPPELLALLERLGIAAETTSHEAVFTVAQSAAVTGAIPGAHSKNLFLKDRRGRLFLVVAQHDTAVDLKAVPARFGASGRVSFGSADLLRDVLGVEPGSVTPFSVVNDEAGRVTVVLDQRLLAHERLNFHPLVNTMTTGISPAGLLRFLDATGHAPLTAELQAEGRSGDCVGRPGSPS